MRSIAGVISVVGLFVSGSRGKRSECELGQRKLFGLRQVDTLPVLYSCQCHRSRIENPAGTFDNLLGDISDVANLERFDWESETIGRVAANESPQTEGKAIAGRAVMRIYEHGLGNRFAYHGGTCRSLEWRGIEASAS